MNKEQATTRELPSYRLAIDKQMEVLKTFSVIEKTKGTGSNYKDIAKQVGVNANNVSDSLKFWKENGFLEGDRGVYTPSQALKEFNQKIQWGDEESAWSVFRNAVKDSWFVTELKIKFHVKNMLTQEELVQTLGLASGISKKDSRITVSINNLVEILEKSKIIAKEENGTYSMNSSSGKEDKKIAIDESKDLVQVSIGDVLYAVDVSKLKEFITSNGKKLSKSIQKVE